ncbi:MAG: WbqC family protein [Campylobacterota bacterium]|nr:WbqC family protein [Campylobacterota bacterium]
MIITIHQPEHFAYFGFLDKVNKADVLVVLDDVQFKKNNFQNRNQILTLNGPKWLSVPVEMKNIEDKNIQVRKIKDNWKEEYKNKIVEAYKKYPFFEENMLWINQMLLLESDLLIDYNMFILEKMLMLLDIDTKIVYASQLNIQTFKTQRLYDICQSLKGSQYLAGQGAIDYLDETVFGHDVKILKHHFIHPEYEQLNNRSDEFIPYMSSLDILMSVGKDAFKAMLKKSKNA